MPEPARRRSAAGSGGRRHLSRQSVAEGVYVADQRRPVQAARPAHPVAQDEGPGQPGHLMQEHPRKRTRGARKALLARSASEVRPHGASSFSVETTSDGWASARKASTSQGAVPGPGLPGGGEALLPAHHVEVAEAAPSIGRGLSCVLAESSAPAVAAVPVPRSLSPRLCVPGPCVPGGLQPRRPAVAAGGTLGPPLLPAAPAGAPAGVRRAAVVVLPSQARPRGPALIKGLSHRAARGPRRKGDDPAGGGRGKRAQARKRRAQRVRRTARARPPRRSWS